jgi:hypothetical protein
MQFVSDYDDLAIEWQASLSVAIIVLVKSHKNKRCLLFDGHLWAKTAADAGTSDTLCWLLELTSSKLLRQYKNLSAFPVINNVSTSQPRNTLCQLLGLPAESYTDPQSLKDLRQCLDVQNIRDRGGVVVVREAHQEECSAKDLSLRLKQTSTDKFIIGI